VALAAAAVTVVLGAQQAESLVPNTVYSATEAQCRAKIPQYSGSFTRIIQGCTYSGPKLFGWHLDPGPWFFIYTTR